MNDNKVEKKLRVWHIPQIPMKAFHVPVTDVEDAIRVLNILWDYDTFQFENDVKGDYSNASGLEEYDHETKEWSEWYDPDMDEDICELIRNREIDEEEES